MESLRSIGYEEPFDAETHGRQNSLDLKLLPTCEEQKKGFKG